MDVLMFQTATKNTTTQTLQLVRMFNLTQIWTDIAFALLPSCPLAATTKGLIEPILIWFKMVSLSHISVAFLPNWARFPKLGHNPNAAQTFHRCPLGLWLDKNIKPRLSSIHFVGSEQFMHAFWAFWWHFSQTGPDFPNWATTQMLHRPFTGDL